MEFKNKFMNLLKRSKAGLDSQNNTLASFEVINGYRSYFRDLNGDLLDDLTIRTCIHTIAKHTAKLKPCHIREAKGQRLTINDDLNRLLRDRPNPLQSTFDFIYKATVELLINGNCYIHIKRAPLGNIEGLYILNPYTVQLKEKNNILFCVFTINGKPQAVEYSEIIHLRHNYGQNALKGDSSTQALANTIDVLNVSRQSISNKIKNSGAITGVLKLAGSTSVDNWYTKALDFANKFKNFKNQTGGLAAIDSTAEFQNVPVSVNTAEEAHFNFLKKEIYSYFGLNNEIITGVYNEKQYQAFYESIIEPLALQFSQEFTEKIFTAKEKGHGNLIVFNSNRLTYTSTENKVNMIRELGALGIISVNEARALFELEPVEDGEKRLVSLNFVNADKADKYQLNESPKTLKGGEKE